VLCWEICLLIHRIFLLTHRVSFGNLMVFLLLFLGGADIAGGLLLWKRGLFTLFFILLLVICVFLQVAYLSCIHSSDTWLEHLWNLQDLLLSDPKRSRNLLGYLSLSSLNLLFGHSCKIHYHEELRGVYSWCLWQYS